MNSLKNAMVIGLTGQSGAGKTTVCRIFKEKGFEIINADMISRYITEKNKPCLDEIVKAFGENILLENGELNRRRLGSIVFSDSSELEKLNSICYPYITAEILKRIRSLSENNRKLIILDAPTLFESHADDFCELIVSVVASIGKRTERIIRRDGISMEEAIKRINSQHDEQFFRNNSDFIINNNGNLYELDTISRETADKIRNYYDKNMISG